MRQTVNQMVSMPSHYERTRPNSLALFRKYWNSKLSENELPFEESFYLQKLRSWDEPTYTNDSVKLFMKPYESDTPDPEVDTVVSFSNGTSLNDLLRAAPCQGRAWLDDSTDGTCDNDAASKPRTYRPYEGHHTAFELWQHLKTQVTHFFTINFPKCLPWTSKSYIKERNG
jgi:hypothetical protein